MGQSFPYRFSLRKEAALSFRMDFHTESSEIRLIYSVCYEGKDRTSSLSTVVTEEFN